MDRARFASHSGAGISRYVMPFKHGRPMAPTLAIIGAGMGGLTLAAALDRRGIEARI